MSWRRAWKSAIGDEFKDKGIHIDTTFTRIKITCVSTKRMPDSHLTGDKMDTLKDKMPLHSPFDAIRDKLRN